PTHMGNLQRGIARCDAFDFAGDPAQALRHDIFAAALRHELHTDTDAEKRPPTPAHAVIERLQHSLDPIKSAPTIRERAYTGQHHTLGAAHLLGIARDQDRLREALLARGAFERFRGRVKIARTIVD